MQPVCLFIIIVLGVAALWIILEPDNLPASPEYYFSGGTALPPSCREAARNAGPHPLHASDMFEPPRNPYANARSPEAPRENELVQAGPYREGIDKQVLTTSCLV